MHHGVINKGVLVIMGGSEVLPLQKGAGWGQNRF